jgi:LPPG:FO 2-phospho-L-lactate transferase
VLDAIRTADVVLLPPSNPVVSVGIILGVPGVRDALRGTRAPVVGVSPLVGGRPCAGTPMPVCAPSGCRNLRAAVAGLYADFLTGWLVDDSLDEAGEAPAGVHVRRRPLLMRDLDSAANLAGAALGLGLELRRR